MNRWTCYTSFSYLIHPIWIDVFINAHPGSSLPLSHRSYTVIFTMLKQQKRFFFIFIWSFFEDANIFKLHILMSKITTWSFPHIGKSKEMDYVRKIRTWGDKWFKSSVINFELTLKLINIWLMWFTATMEALLRDHRIINTWSIVTNEVSKLLWSKFPFFHVFFSHLNNDL